jgi:hypothetical protein
MSDQTSAGIARDVSAAIDELTGALQQANAATAKLSGLLPRIEAIGSVLDELDTMLQSGRRQLGRDTAAPSAPAPITRPTLVVPATPEPADTWTAKPQLEPPAIAPISSDERSWESDEPEDATSETIAQAQARADTVSFRLEFESRSGPLDLRTVDDAVSEHPAVRDVALLDYDGRKATLKVWIEASASPADVQQSLTDRASTLFDGANDITIIALEDVA